MVFIVCGLVTGVVVSQQRAAEDAEAFASFSQNAQRLTRDVELRLASLTQLASGAAGLLGWGASLSREGWTSYIGGLQTIGFGSGFQGLGVAFRVAPAASERFVAAIRKVDVPNFRIWDRAATRRLDDELFPVTYLVPASASNERVVGFDLGSTAASAAPIMLARDRGEPGVSGPMRDGLASDATLPALYLFAPFYKGARPATILARREAFGGVVLVALNPERLLQPLLEQGGARGVVLRVTDMTQGTVVFDSRPGLDHFRSRLAMRAKLTPGGRVWQLDFAATPELAATVKHRNSLLVGLVGAFGTLLFTGIAYHITTLRRSAEQRAREMTAELRASEDELMRHRDHLAELVAERTADLLAAKNAAERAYRIKSDFLANMSHELRTPLHAILSFARLGLDQLGGRGDEKAQRYFARVVEAGERLLALVSDLLDLSKIEAGKMPVDLQPCDLMQLLREVAAEFEALAEERELHWHLPSAGLPAVATIDALRFSQVLRNVMSNAMKFSPDGGVIEVLVSETTMVLGRRAADRSTSVAAWRIEVIDEGVGIPEDELETVFDSFVQSSKTRTGAGGTGLGLTICREIVAAHRGRISARNRAEGGAVFEILVPR
ncbi:MAG: hypothetical protein A3H93_01480 [Rhodocyclales bacterium RIFCSPLOWO2_02_FULL_63_24]|nr:MAG: hypothetical protein A2040_17170 [Rhodocyclales bacterium GWA2_65_19]OHC70083.1 MAG: hypothetical protein A3H93_01480 [Rhodocyclales bacterium RIFCSPLOWO2_02_FULL_63_24]